jgi:hypothetical protein
LRITVQLPQSDEIFVIDTNSAVKVKNLKEVIKERINHPTIAKASVDCLQLQIDGGDYLKKNSLSLEEANVKNNANLLISISAKPSREGGTQSSKKKDEPKIQIIYKVRNPKSALAAKKVEDP